jgi:serine protease Do
MDAGAEMMGFDGDRPDVRKAVGDARKNGKHAVLMRVRSDDTMKFVAIPIARA